MVHINLAKKLQKPWMRMLNLPANEIGETNGNARVKNRVTRSEGRSWISAVNFGNRFQLSLKNNGHNDPVDGNGFAEDDTVHKKT